MADTPLILQPGPDPKTTLGPQDILGLQEISDYMVTLGRTLFSLAASMDSYGREDWGGDLRDTAGELLRVEEELDRIIYPESVDRTGWYTISKRQPK